MRYTFEFCMSISIKMFNLNFSIFYKKWQDYNYDYDERYGPRRTDFSAHRYRFLKVQMNEGDKSAVYTLKFNSTKRGLWMGSEPPKVMPTFGQLFACSRLNSDNACQKVLSWKSHKYSFSLFFLQGSILKRHPNHSHFKGTIQVMKAVANHLVLSFCEQSEIFTIIFSRTKNIAIDVSILSDPQEMKGWTLNINFSKPLWMEIIWLKINNWKRFSPSFHFTWDYIINLCIYADDKKISIIDFLTPSLIWQDIESIHNLLQRRGLAVQSVRELCRYNSAIHLTTSHSLLLTMVLIAMLLSFHRNYF